MMVERKKAPSKKTSLKNILFYADGAPGEKAALKRAILEANHSKSRLYVVDLVAEVSTNESNPTVTRAIKKIQKSLISERQQVLQQMIDELCPTKNPRVKALVVPGNDPELLETIAAKNIDLVMKSADKRSAIGNLFGHNDMRLLRKCPCPVWIIKPGRKKSIRKIVAAIDPEHTSAALNDKILNFAQSMADLEKADLTVLHAWQLQIDNATQARLGAAYLKELKESLKAEQEAAIATCVANHGDIKTEIHTGQPETVIPKYVKDKEIDLLVMGTVARTGIPGFFIGNTAERILNQADCSVLALKPDGFNPH